MVQTNRPLLTAAETALLQMHDYSNRRGAKTLSKALYYPIEQVLAEAICAPKNLREIYAELLEFTHIRRCLEAHLLDCERRNSRDRHDCQPRRTQSRCKSNVSELRTMRLMRGKGIFSFQIAKLSPNVLPSPPQSCVACELCPSQELA